MTEKNNANQFTLSEIQRAFLSYLYTEENSGKAVRPNDAFAGFTASTQYKSIVLKNEDIESAVLGLYDAGQIELTEDRRITASPPSIEHCLPRQPTSPNYQFP